MHIFYVDGIFNHHFGLMMYELRKTAFNYNFVDAYVKLWEWPAAVAANHGKAVCERGHLHIKSKRFSCTASEGRSLLPVLANLVANTRIPIGDHAVAFLALAKCMELCDATARRHVDPQHLRDCITEHAEHYKRLFGSQWIFKKNHYAFHLADQLEILFYLLNCWALERKHKTPKRFANQTQNLTAPFDVSVHREVTALHIQSLKLEPHHFTERPRLINPHPIYKSMLKHLDLNGIPADAFQMARTMKFNEYEACTVGDVVFLAAEAGNRFAAGKIHMLISISKTSPGDEEVAALIESWEYRSHTERCTKWNTSNAPLKCVLASQLLHTAIWSQTGSIASVLLPLHMKH